MKCGVEKGTCKPRCEDYGTCHCGCGEATAVASQSRTRNSRNRAPTHQIKGHHFAFVLGHTPGSHKNRAIPHPRKVYPPQEVWGMTQALVCAYGLRGAAKEVGVHYTTLNRIRAGRKGCYEDVYHRIRRAYNRLDPCPIRLDPRPLFAYLERKRYDDWSSCFEDSHQRKLYRWMHEDSVPLLHIDEFITTVLGVHPVEVYGDWYEMEAS